MDINPKLTFKKLWISFRSLPIFYQLLLTLPLLVGAIPYLIIGNMGLALMGTAIGINTFFVGWLAGVGGLFWSKSKLDQKKHPKS